MASNTRSGRRPAAPATSSSHLDIASLSNVERLLVAQAVYELGANAWTHVSKLLSKHPMLSRPKSFFTAQSCHAIYDYLMKEAGLEILEANNAPKNDKNLKLAQKHYQARVLELQSLILDEEAKFKKIVAEIEEIRSGLWDAKIKAKITGIPIEENVADEKPPTESVQNEVAVQDVAQADEGFGSDLTGITDSDEAVKASRTTNSSKENGESPPVQDAPQDIIAGPTGDLPVPEDTDEFAADTITTQAAPALDPTLPDEEPFDQDPEAMHGNVLEPESPEHTVGTPAEDDTDVSVVDIDVSAGVDADEGDRSPSSPAQATSSRRREGKRKVSDIEEPSPESHREKKRVREESEPMDEDEQGPSSAAARRRRERLAPTEEQVANKRFQNVIGMLHSQISQHRNGNIFHNPIKDSEAPDYREIVKRPMDLKTVKARIKDGVITTSLEFQRDVFLMFTNAMMYNRPDSDIYTMAGEMMLESEGHINAFRQTEGLIGGHTVSRGSRPFSKGTMN